ncbi:MAG: glycosyltransferase [Roseiflexaceae bacterium]
MKRPLHIACISEHASPLALLGSQDAGGQNVYVDEVSRQLGRLGHSVDIFTRRDNPSVPEIVAWAPGVRVINLAVGPPKFMPKDELWTLMPEFLDAMLRFMARAGAHYDLIHSHFWMSGWVAVQLRRRLGLPVAHIFHALGITKRRHQGSADTSPPARIAIEREVIREVDRLIAQCPSERAELIDDYAADPHKIAVIPAAANIARFRPVPRGQARRRLGLDQRDFVVVYVGRMLPRKDVRNIVRGFALLADRARSQAGGAHPTQPLKLLLVGGESCGDDLAATPEIGVLQELAAELGIVDRVLFAGKRQPDELPDFYSAGDVMVTTPWYEPFGLTPLEAMACGRLVIGSAVGGLPFTIQDGTTGMLVPPRDPAALAAKLHQLLAQPDLCAAMGRAARRRVEREFTWENVARRIEKLYQALLATHDQRAYSMDVQPALAELAIREARL